MLHESVEDSLRQQRRDPLDDFRRCIDAVNNRHAPNVVSRLPCWVHARMGRHIETLVSQLTARTEVVRISILRRLSPVAGFPPYLGNRLLRA